MKIRHSFSTTIVDSKGNKSEVSLVDKGVGNKSEYFVIIKGSMWSLSLWDEIACTVEELRDKLKEEVKEGK